MRYLFIVIFFCVGIFATMANEIDNLTRLLNKEIACKQDYDRQKELKIKELKALLKMQDISLAQKYEVNYQLSAEYKKYNVDSAVYYIQENLEIAKQLHNSAYIIPSLLNLSLLYSATGRYVEAKKILDGIDRHSLAKEDLPLFFDTYSHFYEYYAQSNNQNNYLQLNEAYRDSLLTVIDKNSMQYKISYAEKMLYQGQLEIAKSRLLELLGEVDDNSSEYALITYLLGNLYKGKHDVEEQKKYYILSAICDIRNSIKDNASMQSLALIFYQSGDIGQAYILTESALEDAAYSKVRFRTIELSQFYSIVNTAYLAKEMKQKTKLQFYLVCISILSLFLIIMVVYIYKQMKRLSKIRKELYHTNVKLKKLNDDISNTNTQLSNVNQELSESNHIKEEYIAQFFDMCSAYINRLESYRKTLNKKAINHELDELFKMLKSNAIIENELDELYENFDAIFLNLYPTFVDEFNSLLIPEEQINLKQGEILNTELRIFALIRLGITDSVKIAGFLRYSLSTIYNYRTKARNKAVVSRDEFEKMVAKIGSIH